MAIKDQTHFSTPAGGDVRPSDASSHTRRILFLGIGDALVFLAFAIIGILSHGKTLSLINLVNDSIPLMLGWFIVAPLVGAFSRTKTNEVGKMALYTILAWLPSFVLGMIFRGVAVEHTVPQTSFMIVTLIINMIFLLIWRVPFVWLRRKK